MYCTKQCFYAVSWATGVFSGLYNILLRLFLKFQFWRPGLTWTNCGNKLAVEQKLKLAAAAIDTIDSATDRAQSP